MESLKFGFEQSPTWKANSRTVWTLNANKLFAALLVEYTSSSPWDLKMLLAEASELSLYVQETQCTKAQAQQKYESTRNRTFKTGRANLHDVLQEYYSQDQLKALECFLQEIREKQKLGHTFEAPCGEHRIEATKPTRSTPSQEQCSTSSESTSSDDGSCYTSPRKRTKTQHHRAQPSTSVASVPSQNSHAEGTSRASTSPTPRASRSQAPSQEEPCQVREDLPKDPQGSRRPSIEPLSSEPPAEAVLNPLNEGEGGGSTETGLNVTKSLDITLTQWESHLILAMREYLDVPRFQSARIPPFAEVNAALSGIVQQLKKGIAALVRYTSFQGITAHRMWDAGYNLCSTLVGGHYDLENGDIERNLEVLLSRCPALIEMVLLALSMSFVTKDILQPFGDLQASLPEPFQDMELVKRNRALGKQLRLLSRPAYLTRIVEPSFPSRARDLSRRLADTLSQFNDQPENATCNRRDTSDKHVSIDERLTQQRIWEEHSTAAMQQALELAMICECSGLEYIFDFPTFKTAFNADTMEVEEGSGAAEKGSPIWLCLWPHVESLTADPNMHPRVTVVKAKVIVD